MTIQNIIEKFDKMSGISFGSLEDRKESYHYFLQSSLTELLDSVDEDIKKVSPAYIGVLESNNDRRIFEAGFHDCYEEVINIINSHR